MSDSVYMYYGDYEFDPVPLISIDRTTRRIGGKIVGYNFQMTLNGNIVAYTPKDPAQNPSDFQNNVQEIDLLREAFSSDCQPFIVQCGLGEEATQIISCNPKIESLNFKESNNNWVNTIPYTITLSYTDTDQFSESDSIISNDNSFDPITQGVDPSLLKFIEDYSVSWNVEFEKESKWFQIDLGEVSRQNYSGSSGDYYGIDSNNPFEATVTRSINVQGIAGCVGGSGTVSGAITASGQFNSAIDNAYRFLQPILTGDYNPIKWGHGVSGITNLTSEYYSKFDHYRSYVTNEVAGSIELTESWIVIGTSGVSGNLIPCKEDFSVNISKSLTEPKTSVSIEGQIRGYETRSFTGEQLPTNTTVTAYSNAALGFSSVNSRLFPRVQYFFEQDVALGTGPAPAPLNPVPANRTVGHQLNKGIITYNIEYDNRPCSFIEGSLTENITINDTNPTDVFASLAVLGRKQGPILQDIGTVTSPVREINFEVTMPTPTSCSLEGLDQYNPESSVAGLLCDMRASLNSSFQNVYTSNDNSTWNPLTGRYSRTVAWTLSQCSGDFTQNGPCNPAILPQVGGSGSG